MLIRSFDDIELKGRLFPQPAWFLGSIVLAVAVNRAGIVGGSYS
jgi:hypothetical protein